MANTTIEELLNLAYEVRDADQDRENTALRVGGLFTEIIQYLTTVVDLTTLQDIMEQYATLSGTGGLIYWRHSRIICLASMGYDLDNIDGGNWNYTDHNGDIVFRPSSAGGGLRVVGTTDDYSVFSNVVYVNNHTGHAYIWKQVGSTFKMVEIRDSSTTTIINYLNTPPFSQVAVGESYYYSSGNNRKIAIKLSSDEVYSFDPDPKKIYVFLDTRQAMVWDAGNRQWISVGGGNVDVINNLTSTYTDKPLSAKMGRDLLLLIQQIYSSLGHAAFWAEKPEIDWEGIGFTMYGITRSLSSHAHAGSSVAKVAEGSLYSEEISFDIGYCKLAITVTMGGADITSSAVSGNTITIQEVTGPITITVTEQASLSVIFQGTGCSLVSSNPSLTDIVPGGSVTLQLATTNGYELPSTVNYGNGQTAPVVNGQVTISNIQSNITVTATAVSITEFFENGLRFVIKTLITDVAVTSKDGFTDLSTANKTEAYAGDIVIPATVTHDGALYNVKEVGTCAFANCALVTSVTIQGSLNLRKRSFSGCGATNFDFGSGEIRLYPFTGTETSYVFDSMPNIKSLVFPDNVIVDGYNPSAFLQSCGNLKLVKFGTGWKRSTSYSLTNLADGCTLDYADCTQLDGNTFDAHIGTIVLRHTGGVVAKGGRISAQTIYVPDDLVAAYQADSSWAGITIKPLIEYEEPIIS